jgi:membrane-bound lytic murein transglycosylase A
MTHMRSAFLPLIVLIAACAPLPPCPQCPAPKLPETAVYLEYAFEALPGWPSAGLEQSLSAFLAGCPRPAPLAKACEAARFVSPADAAAARAFFEAHFVPYALVSSEGVTSGLITGYYEPLIQGSRARNERFRHPIFGVPEDLIVVDLASVNPDVRNLRLRGRLEGRRLVPYRSRAEIETKGVPAPVIAWSSDPVELFFLQIQGSGQVELDTGERIRIGFADQNGHPYRSLGRYLIDRGELVLEQSSMQGIKEWAAANPTKLQEALNANPSYVFFRELAPSDGPPGALGVPLTPEYSLAVDRRYVPLGAPVYLATTYPSSEAPLERLMAAQDTGGAIRGVVRADFYWGTGPQAGALAGRMRQQGSLWVLWPRGEPPPRAD